MGTQTTQCKLLCLSLFSLLWPEYLTKQLKVGKVYFGLQFEDTVHHSREVIASACESAEQYPLPQNTNILSIKLLCTLWGVYVSRYAPHAITHQRTDCGSWFFFLLPHVSWGWNSCLQVCHQVPLPTEPSHQHSISPFYFNPWNGTTHNGGGVAWLSTTINIIKGILHRSA